VTLPAEKELNFWGTPWPLSAGRKHLQSLGSFTFNYLRKFKLNAPGDAIKVSSFFFVFLFCCFIIKLFESIDGPTFLMIDNFFMFCSDQRPFHPSFLLFSRCVFCVLKVATGEASPDYLVSIRTVLPNILRFAPTMKVIVSLREPINRCVSAYENKVADKTVHKHLDEHLYHGHVDKRKDDQVLSWMCVCDGDGGSLYGTIYTYSDL